MAKGAKKACKSCGSENLLCAVTITKMIPLADRNGTVKIGGQKVGQMDLKNYWDYVGGVERSGNEQLLRGPIYCADCETEHYYVVGSKKNPLRVGSVVEARRAGIDAALAED
jgi:hypothetical protein